MRYAIWFRHGENRLWETFTELPSNTPEHLTVIRNRYFPNKLEADLFCKWRKGFRTAIHTEYRAFEEGVNPNMGVVG